MTTQQPRALDPNVLSQVETFIVHKLVSQSDIDYVQRAVIYTNMGANVITPDVNINRDLKLLKQIIETTGAELKLMVNEGCLYKCPFRKFHFNYISHKSKKQSLRVLFLVVPVVR